ncbi:uncharacterized protein METZ01_LOCUS12937 [marine metagenome]|uniref:Uncharacterized protein n=1 Tax=marine metagenome TaxID=408172 RepID=A0A381P359_9ZZZZ
MSLGAARLQKSIVFPVFFDHNALRLMMITNTK